MCIAKFKSHTMKVDETAIKGKLNRISVLNRLYIFGTKGEEVCVVCGWLIVKERCYMCVCVCVLGCDIDNCIFGRPLTHGNTAAHYIVLSRCAIVVEI